MKKPRLPAGGNGEIMKYEEIMAAIKDINGPWSNTACMGYCLIAMRRAGLRPTVQRRVLRVLEGVFDDVSVEEAEKAGYANKEEGVRSGPLYDRDPGEEPGIQHEV